MSDRRHEWNWFARIYTKMAWVCHVFWHSPELWYHINMGAQNRRRDRKWSVIFPNLSSSYFGRQSFCTVFLFRSASQVHHNPTKAKYIPYKWLMVRFTTDQVRCTAKSSCHVQIGQEGYADGFCYQKIINMASWKNCAHSVQWFSHSHLRWWILQVAVGVPWVSPPCLLTLGSFLDADPSHGRITLSVLCSFWIPAAIGHPNDIDNMVPHGPLRIPSAVHIQHPPEAMVV